MSDPYLGQLLLFGGNFAIRGWAACDGQLLAISSNAALFSILGTTYGGDGRSTFGLPDLRGRVPVGEGHGSGLSAYTLGQKGGAETVTLSTAQIPSHTHALSASAAPGTSSTAAGNVLGTYGTTIPPAGPYAAGDASQAMGSTSIGNAGGSQSHNNVQPYQVLTWLIATTGRFPSRN